MVIKQDFIPQSAAKRPMTKQSVKYITIHSTGNPSSTGKNERGWLTNKQNTRQASWHYVVDAKEVIQAIPDNEVAYHAGDGQGNGNRASIGIELCESGDRAKVLASGAKLAANLLIKHGLTLDKMVQHNRWSGKNCPRILRDKSFIAGNMDWSYFHGLVKAELEGGLEMVKQSKIVLNGAEKIVSTIEKEGENYIRLRDLADSKIKVDYDKTKKMPTVKVG